MVKDKVKAPFPLTDFKQFLQGRTLVLIGMMGAGKSSVGRRLAQVLELPFIDADHEIEKAAGQTIAEIFKIHGEAYFRDGERRVIKRLFKKGPRVMATGGGAFMDGETRNLIRRQGVSIWLKASLPTLMARVRRKPARPLLHTENPDAVMAALLKKRTPFYALADLTVKSQNVPHERVVSDILAALASLMEEPSSGSKQP